MSTATLDRDKAGASNSFRSLARGNRGAITSAVGLVLLALVAVGIVYADVVTGARFDREGEDD